MAEISNRHVRQKTTDGSNEVGEVKWAKHYSSNHQILLVGEGDFSFALSLAMSFGSASNIVASSLDSYNDLIKKYKRAETNLEMLHNFGAQLLHGVDSFNMKLHTDLRMRKFDRIIYNFPHAGFLGKESDDFVIKSHKKLVHGFFKNTCGLLRPNGEVHVTHKMERPFDSWNIEELATRCGLTLLECVKFKINYYPGYTNKRGDGLNPDHPFNLGKCSTFKFIFSTKAMKLTTSHHRSPQQSAPDSLPRSLTPAMSALLEASRLNAVEDRTKQLNEELKSYSSVLSANEKKILKIKSDLEGVRGELVVSEAKIVQLEGDKFDLLKKLNDKCSQLEEKGKRDAADVADLEWLIETGISSIIWRLLKSGDFAFENAMIQGACVDLGFQKGCRRMRDTVAPDMPDSELPGFEPDVEKNMKVAHYALAEAKLSVMDYLTENGVKVAKLKKWCEEDLEVTSQPSHI